MTEIFMWALVAILLAKIIGGIYWIAFNHGREVGERHPRNGVTPKLRRAYAKLLAGKES